MRYLLLITMLLVASRASSQGEDNNWAFGKQAGISFNSGSPVSFTSAITGYGEGCASISDASGQLLFYTEGTDVWDRNGNIMPNGSNLTGLPYITVNPTTPVSPTSSTTQGSVIVSVPYQPRRYYVFSLSSQQLEMGVNGGKLYYSIVDMNLNGGLGDVVTGSKGIFLQSGLDEKMTAVLGDHCNIWIIAHQKGTNSFASFEVTSSGVSSTPVVSVAGTANPAHYVLGTIKVSPNRKKLVSCNTYQILFAGIGSLELFDFDPATGIISNAMMLDNLATYGAAFSPSSTRLYASRYNTGQVHQYNISLGTVAAITASRTLVANNQFTDMKTGPDGRIYMGGVVSGGTINSLSVINAPNNPPASCGFMANAIPLATGTSFFAGLPNSNVVFTRDTVHTFRKVIVCFRDSFQLHSDTLNKGWDHIWNTGVTGQNMMATTNGLYVINYITPPCVLRIDSFDVSFQSPVPQLVSFPGCKELGNGYVAVVPIAGDTTHYVYTWTDNNGSLIRQHGPSLGDTLFTSITGIYKVALTGSNGCDTTLSVELKKPQYEATFTVPPFICITDSLRPLNLSSGFGSYTWTFGDGGSSVAPNPAHLYSRPGAYTIILTGMPCADTAIRTVTVDTMSYVRFTSDKGSFCEGTSILFYPESPGSPDSLRWLFAGSTFTGMSNIVPYAFDTSGTLQVTLTAFFRACPDTSFTDSVVVHPFPVVNLGTDTAMCPGGQPLRLHNLAPDNTNDIYTWNTGIQDPSILARHPGIYALTVSNEWGCSTADSIEIFKNCYIDIPNAFSPNGDGINDNFIPRQYLSNGLKTFKMQIFNRWGQIIFETDRIDGRGWDGLYNGLAQPSGVYVYLIEASFINGSEERYQGNVTLIR